MERKPQAQQPASEVWARHWPFTPASPALIARVERERRQAQRRPPINTPAPW